MNSDKNTEETTAENNQTETDNSPSQETLYLALGLGGIIRSIRLDSEIHYYLPTVDFEISADDKNLVEFDDNELSGKLRLTRKLDGVLTYMTGYLVFDVLQEHMPEGTDEVFAMVRELAMIHMSNFSKKEKDEIVELLNSGDENTPADEIITEALVKWAREYCQVDLSDENRENVSAVLRDYFDRTVSEALRWVFVPATLRGKVFAGDFEARALQREIVQSQNDEEKEE